MVQRFQENNGLVTDGDRNPTKRKRPAAMMAAELGLMIMALTSRVALRSRFRVFHETLNKPAL
jgi:hypothetical protein